jgi:hypothetical protein
VASALLSMISVDLLGEIALRTKLVQPPSSTLLASPVNNL